MPRPNLTLSFTRTKPPIAPKNYFEPFSKQQLLNFLKSQKLEPTIYPHLFDSSQQQLNADEETLMMDYLLKMEFPTLRQKKLLRRGGSGGGRIIIDDTNTKVMKIINATGSFENEKKAAELIMKLDPTLPLPSIKGIYPSIKTIIYVNKFENGVTLDALIAELKETDAQIAQTLAQNLMMALKRLHDIGVYHGDIKPQNILVNPINMEIQFIDIGSVGMGTLQTISQQKIYDLSNTTITLLPTRLRQYLQANKSVDKSFTELRGLMTLEDKLKLDGYALFLILKQLIPLTQQLQTLQKQGQQVAKKILKQSTDLLF
jgi:serine/threonine protein kinase